MLLGLTGDTVKRNRPRVSAADLTVYLLLLLLGALQYASYPHTNDFVNDAMYPDLARSLLENGSYQFDFSPETTLPPGFAVILAFVAWVVGFSPAAMFHVVALCTTLGLITAYELLRRVEGRAVAAAACLLLGSSAAVFQFNTQVVFSDMPFFFVSMLVLWMALKIDRSEPGSARVGWTLLFSAGLVMAVLIRSAGIALVGGLGMWMVVSRFMVPKRGRLRIRMFWIPLVLGLAAQLMWSEWAQHRQKLEWQLGGWPQPYWSQLKMKRGNDPELGTAQWSDIPARVEQNMEIRSIELGKLLTGRWISQFWSSPAVLGVLLLIPLGLAVSFRGGGQLYDWYFLLHEIVYLLWPWDFELRFLLPVVPLGCLYLWRGGKTLWKLAQRQPRATGFWFLITGVPLSAISAAFAARILRFPVSAEHLFMDRWQPMAAALFWGLLAVIGWGMVKLPYIRIGRAPRWVCCIWESEPQMWLLLRPVALVVLIALAGRGAVLQGQMAWDNVHFDITKANFYPEIEAADWIRTHEPLNRVIMARKQDLVFHYSHHRTVWFPPISTPQVLMEGIERNHITVVVVAHHPESYWWPPEDKCFQALFHSYGQMFHLVHQGPADWVFEVDPKQPGGTLVGRLR